MTLRGCLTIGSIRPAQYTQSVTTCNNDKPFPGKQIVQLLDSCDILHLILVCMQGRLHVCVHLSVPVAECSGASGAGEPAERVE